MRTPTRRTREPFRGSEVVRAGLITWDVLRGPAFRKLHPDVYVGADADDCLAVRVKALSVWSRGRGVVGGPLAALALSVDCPWDDAELILPSHCRQPPDEVTTRVDRLPPDEIVHCLGAATTSAVRTAFDLARREPLIEAVAAADALAHVWRFGADALTAVADRHPMVRGIPQVRRVIHRMDPRAESLPETRLRLGLVDRGVRPGVPQVPVLLRSGQQIHLDLGWPDRMVALEYDGPEHRSIAGQNRDAFRLARVRDLGWDVTTVTSAMVLDPRAFDELAARMRRKLG